MKVEFKRGYAKWEQDGKFYKVPEKEYRDNLEKAQASLPVAVEEEYVDAELNDFDRG